MESVVGYHAALVLNEPWIQSIKMRFSYKNKN